MILANFNPVTCMVEYTVGDKVFTYLEDAEAEVAFLANGGPPPEFIGPVEEA